MPTPTSVRIAGGAIAAAVLGATVVLVAQSASPRVTSVPVCVKANGQVRVLVGGAATCDPSEQRSDWTVGGELTDISIGEGLIGGRNAGTFQLALDPEIVQACTGCRGGRLFAGFNNGPFAIPPEAATTVATLHLPEGSFAIFAKMTIANAIDDSVFADFDRVNCRLAAGDDFDEAVVSVEERGDAALPVGSNDTIGLNLVHRFTEPGTAALTCFASDHMENIGARDLKIIAIEGSSLSNVFLPAP
jgi:hypothetical protein